MKIAWVTSRLSPRPLADRALLMSHPGLDVGEAAADPAPQPGVVLAGLAGGQPPLLEVGRVVFNPEPMNLIIALVAETAMRKSPGPAAGSAAAWVAVVTLLLIGPLVTTVEPNIPPSAAANPAKSIRYAGAAPIP